MDFQILYYYGAGKFAGERTLDDYRERVTHEHVWRGYGYQVGSEKWRYMHKVNGRLVVDRTKGWYYVPVRGQLDCMQGAEAAGLKLHVGANWQVGVDPVLLRDYTLSPFRDQITTIEIADEPDWGANDWKNERGKVKWGLRTMVNGTSASKKLRGDAIWTKQRWAGFRRLLPSASLGITYDRKRLSRLTTGVLSLLDWVGAEIYVDAAVQNDWSAIEADARKQFADAHRIICEQGKRKMVLVPQAFTRSDKWEPPSYKNIVRLNELLWELVKPKAGKTVAGVSWFNLFKRDGASNIPGLAETHRAIFEDARLAGLV